MLTEALKEEEELDKAEDQPEREKKVEDTSATGMSWAAWQEQDGGEDGGVRRVETVGQAGVREKSKLKLVYLKVKKELAKRNIEMRMKGL